MKKRLSVLFIILISLNLFAAEENDLYTALLNQDWLKAKVLLDNNPTLMNKQGEEEFQALLGNHLVESVGKTPLIFCVEYGLDLMTVRLLENGADKEARDIQGWTPLMTASYKGNYNAARLLLRFGAEVDVFDGQGLSPLALAVGAHRFEIADFLLERQANLYDTIPGVFPLAEDIYRKKIEIRDTLRILDVGAPGYPLFKGIEEDDYAKVRTILLQGMYPDSTDSQGVTPLMTAASKESPYLTELLIDQGAQVNYKEKKGLTPLSAALFYGRKRNVDLLIAGEANVNIGSTLENSPLYFAVIGGRGDLVSVLVNRGSVVSRQDEKGRTALMYAAFMGDWVMVQALLKGGANPSALDNEKMGVVFYAMNGYLMTRGDNYYTIIDNLIGGGAPSGEYLYMAGGDRRFYELLENRWRD